MANFIKPLSPSEALLKALKSGKITYDDLKKVTKDSSAGAAVKNAAQKAMDSYRTETTKTLRRLENRTTKLANKHKTHLLTPNWNDD
jgi:hypothetical protein